MFQAVSGVLQTIKENLKGIPGGWGGYGDLGSFMGILLDFNRADFQGYFKRLQKFSRAFQRYFGVSVKLQRSSRSFMRFL